MAGEYGGRTNERKTNKRRTTGFIRCRYSIYGAEGPVAGSRDLEGLVVHAAPLGAGEGLGRGQWLRGEGLGRGKGLRGKGLGRGQGLCGRCHHYGHLVGKTAPHCTVHTLHTAHRTLHTAHCTLRTAPAPRSPSPPAPARPLLRPQPMELCSFTRSNRRSATVSSSLQKQVR
jgi:hypothetical protein